MGDADGDAVIQIPAQEIEAWMDEALGVVDEGFENLLGLVTTLNKRTKTIMLEMKTLESYRNVFFALNFVTVPVAIVIMLCYGTSETVNSCQGFQAVLQSLVWLLMFTSLCVGLPFYILSIWESYKICESINEDPKRRGSRSLATDSHGSLVFDDSLLTPLTSESSLERLSDFAHLLNDRMPRRMRADLQRRRSAENDFSEIRILPEIEISSEIEMESAATETTASVEPSEEKQVQYLDSVEKPKTTEFPILYQFQELMKKQSPNLAMRLKASNIEENKETTENEEMAVRDIRQHTKPREGASTTADDDE